MKELLVQNLNILNTVAKEGEEPNNFHMFSICLVREQQEVDVTFSNRIMYIIIIAAVVTFLVSICIVISIFKTSHVLIRPLRKLNTKMREVMVELSRGKTSGLQPDEDSSHEISILYSIFKDLI